MHPRPALSRDAISAAESIKLQFPNGIVSSVSFVSTTNTARSLAGCVSLALALTPNSHSAGTSAGAPLSLIKNTRNFAGWVALAFRSTT